MTQEELRVLIFDYLNKHPVSISEFAQTMGISPNTLRLFMRHKRKLQVATWKKLEDYFKNLD